MSSPLIFAERGSNGVQFSWGPPDLNVCQELSPVSSKSCRILVFSPSGKHFAYTSDNVLTVVDCHTWRMVGSVENVKSGHIAFSPKGTFLMTWEPFTVSKIKPEGGPNLHIYLAENVALVKSFVHKRQSDWMPQFSDDEKCFARTVNSDVVFYENGNFERIVARIICFKVLGYKLSPQIGNYFVACHTPGSAPGQPSFGRLFKYPKFEAEDSVATKTFFQADTVEFHWNEAGTHCLLLTSMAVDKTGKSYYGKQALHYMGLNGENMIVPLDKEGPVYSVAWSPKSKEFMVVYGNIPPRATLFNLKCEPIYELGTGSWNSIYYNPHGNIVLIAGFGNLRGHIDVWDAINKSKIGECEAPDSTLLQWCDDGMYFLTATTAPRLRTDNGVKVWHYSGSLLYEKKYPSTEALYDVCWQKSTPNTFKAPTISKSKVESIASSLPQASKQAYCPPHLRNKAPLKFSLYDKGEQEAPHKPGAQLASTNNSSKASIKLKKKREAQRAKRDTNETTTPVASSSVQITWTGNADTDKKLKAIKKKLDDIEKLKSQLGQGKTLEMNQIAKVKTEVTLLEELKQLQL